MQKATIFWRIQGQVPSPSHFNGKRPPIPWGAGREFEFVRWEWHVYSEMTCDRGHTSDGMNSTHRWQQLPALRIRRKVPSENNMFGRTLVGL